MRPEGHLRRSVARCLAVVVSAAAGALAAAPANAAVTGSARPSVVAGHSTASDARQVAKSVALTGVSCSQPRQCLAVGYRGKHFRPPAIAESWNGARWRLTAPPPLRGPISADCVSPSFCLAIGIAQKAPGSGATATWNGSSWKVRPGRPPSVIGRLSCVSPKFCMNSGAGGLTELWNGKSWRDLSAPEPSGTTDINLSGVSCTSPRFCMAVGVYTTDPDSIVPQTVAETWNGSAWKLISSPTHKPTSAFNDVSCTSSQHCVAIGAFFTAARPTFRAHNIAGLWDGTSWHVMRLPGAVGFPQGFDNLNQGPDSISCATASRCMAVGSFLNARTRMRDSVAIAWNGAKWRLTKLRGPRSGIADVSCPSQNRCIAVGHDGNRALAERWDGTTWKLLRTPSV